MDKRKASRIYEALLKRYPDAHCALHYSTALELLFATILSAQATDVGVNKATPKLFDAFPTVQDYANASPEEIEPYIASIGLFRSKAKSIHTSASMIINEFNGKVPNTMEGLLRLRGVARKTANVVLGNAFHKNEGVVVDTHVGRLAQRFSLSKETTPVKIEKDLMALFPQENWTMLSHLLVRHGREVCKKRGGSCEQDSICKRYCSNATI
ncbi:MAG: endonuclease III [Phycisphaerae bacterium]|jgi:endonuclease III|nr:endonuclease III [Phycisphaerae bacterium]